MNFLMLSLILVIPLTLAHSEEEKEEYVNRFCETKTFDYAFNFIDKDQYPNGIMIKKDDFIVVFNDDLYDKSFTKETKILKIYRQNNYTGGMAIKFVPKCPPKESWCPEFKELTYSLQMVITMNGTGDKVVQHYRDHKPVTKEQLKYGFNDDDIERQTTLYPSDWFPDKDLFAFRPQNFEIIFVSNTGHKILWRSLRDYYEEQRYPPLTKFIEFDKNLEFSSVFELNGQIYLVHNKKDPVIYHIVIHPKDQNKKTLEERRNLSLCTLFECQTLCPSKETPYLGLAKFVTGFLNVTMVIIAICFISFVVFHIYSCCTGSHQKIIPVIETLPSTKPKAAKPPPINTMTSKEGQTVI